MSGSELYSLSGKLRRELKSRAKTRPVDVRVGKKGLTGNLVAELRKVFEKEDLVKVAFTQDREIRTTLLAEIEDKLVAVSIAVTGKTATLYKPLPSRK
ncbi:MAG: YhbY family RNA-binding protein [Opitutales bacterium]